MIVHPQNLPYCNLCLYREESSLIPSLNTRDLDLVDRMWTTGNQKKTRTPNHFIVPRDQSHTLKIVGNKDINDMYRHLMDDKVSYFYHGQLARSRVSIRGVLAKQAKLFLLSLLFQYSRTNISQFSLREIRILAPLVYHSFIHLPSHFRPTPLETAGPR